MSFDKVFTYTIILFVFGAVSYALIYNHLVIVERKNIGNLSSIRDNNSAYFWFFVLWCIVAGAWLDSWVCAAG